VLPQKKEKEGNKGGACLNGMNGGSPKKHDGTLRPGRLQREMKKDSLMEGSAGIGQAGQKERMVNRTNVKVELWNRQDRRSNQK